MVLLVLGYIYMAYFSGPPTPTLSASDPTAVLSQNLLVTLQNLHTIKLDNGIFGDPAFQSLSDFGVAIPAENVGRRNPFEAVAGGAVVNSSIKLPTSR